MQGEDSRARTVGIIGAGQLGRMLALAGIPLGFRFVFLDPARSPCAAALGEHIRAPFDDEAALSALAKRSSVVTYEFENVDVRALQAACAATLVRPSAAALSVAQSRRAEKTRFSESDIPVAGWRAARTASELAAAFAAAAGPLIVKTDRLGYDGKGQARIDRPADTDAGSVFDALGGVELIAEDLVAFDYEVSLIGTRDGRGNIRAWPLTVNRHADGILVESRASHEPHALQALAEEHFRALSVALDYVGTMAIEFFVVADTLFGNEFAPRVHNSGHWTLDGSTTSQFENHIRAVCDLELGESDVKGHVAMRNFIGWLPARDRVLAIPGARFHDYDKSPRPGRKIGHATLVCDTALELTNALTTLDACTGQSAGDAV